MEPHDVTHFASPAALRAWFEVNHETATELWIGYYRRGTGLPSLTWPESVDQALCFGWIDGIRKRVDDRSYTIRLTPRKPTSIWSVVNIGRVAELTAAGLMREPGLAAFDRRRADRSGIYSFEQATPPALHPAEEAVLMANAAAAAFFGSQPAGYRRTAVWWVISAKRRETRARRLATLIEDSAAGRTITHLTRRPPA